MAAKNKILITLRANPGISVLTTIRTAYALAAAVVLLGLIALASPATAQDGVGGGVKMAARAGYDGYYKGDFWVPVFVSAANQGPSIEGHLQIVTGSGGSNDQVIYRSPISLPTSSNKGQTVYVHVSSFADELSVQLLDEADDVVATTQSNRLSSLAADGLLYAVVTKEPGRLEYLDGITAGRSEAAVAYLGLAEIPEVAAALNSLDIIIFHEVDTGQLSAGQREALESWLDTGGQLVVIGGPAWQETTAGLAGLLPVTVTGTKSVDDIPALREFGKLPFRDPGPYIVTESNLRSGETLIHQDGTPLLARQDHGRGSVFFLALDPGLAPLLDWQGNNAVWSEIANYARPLPDWANGARHSYAATSAVSSLPASDLPPAWALFIFLVVYVVVVGPINYLVLRRLGRRELAWLTIPLLVLFFSVSTYLVGFGLKGNETIINQMSIIYGQTEGKQARVQTLIGLYSPRRATYDLELPAEAIPRPFERSFGALGGQGNIEAIERSDKVVVSGIRVDVGGVETLVADSYQPTPDVTGSVRLRPSAGDVVLEIDIFNNGSVTLENATLLAGSTAIALGDLAPGSSVSHTEQISSLGQSPAAGTAFGAYVPPPPTTTPLLANQEAILGSADYYNDREVYTRWQLLQAMAPEYGFSNRSYAPNAFTLIAWSQQPQLDLRVLDDESISSATSLYFLELPASQPISSQEKMVVPRHLLNWAVLAEDGVYDARVDDLFLPEGSVEFEYTPWSDVQSMTVEDLSVIVQPPNGLATQQLPRVRLWDWGEESWRTAGDPTWGRITIEDPLRYVGPGNTVRIQLINPGEQAINIQHVYPELTGTLE